MSIDTSTPEGLRAELHRVIADYTRNRNWIAMTRLMGGSPKYDLQDLTDADAGEPPLGAEWK